MDETELDSSELGTQSYWQQAYSKEIANFDEHGDPGDVWFGEDSAFRVIKWVCRCVDNKNAAIVDLGCGNGYTLCELAREGFANLLGVDYCPEAIALAEKVSKREFPIIKFKIFDIINDKVEDLGTDYRVVHDKGTYDAISLNPDNSKEKRLKYIEQVAELMAGDGLFIITSCNWTEQELIKQFSEKLRLKCVIPTPQFKFGGKLKALAVPHLANTKGNIVKISNVVSTLNATGNGFTPYSVSKAALDHLMRYAATELGPLGIRVNNINPGPVISDFLANADVKDDGLSWENLAKVMLLGRVSEPEEIADLTLFLASDKARCITGVYLA